MQPLGQQMIRFPSKTDIHVHGKMKRQGYVNWWENGHGYNKAYERQMVVKEINEGVLEYIDTEG